MVFLNMDDGRITLRQVSWGLKQSCVQNLKQQLIQVADTWNFNARPTQAKSPNHNKKRWM